MSALLRSLAAWVVALVTACLVGQASVCLAVAEEAGYIGLDLHAARRSASRQALATPLLQVALVPPALQVCRAYTALAAVRSA